jgi:hypothetical protein
MIKELFELIRSMTPTEKRYFRVHTSRKSEETGSSGSNQYRYLDLFDQILSMDRWDEQRLKKDDNPYLAQDKKYLYETILKLMREYRSKRSAQIQVRNMLQDIEYLNEKELYHHAQKLIKRAKKLAQKYEDNIALLQISQMEIMFIARVREKTLTTGQIQQIITEKNHALNRVRDELEYLGSYVLLFKEFLHHRLLTDEDQKQQLRRLISEEIFDESQKPQSIPGLRRFHQAKALYYQLLGEFEESYENFSIVLELWRKHPSYKYEMITAYITDISNFLTACLYSEKHMDSMPGIIKEFDRVEAKTMFHRNMVFEKRSSYILLYAMNSNQIDTGIEFANSYIIKEKALLKTISVKSRINILYNLLCLYLEAGKYKDALELLQMLQPDLDRLPHQVAISICRFHTILQYEIGEDPDKGLDNIRKYLIKNRMLPDDHKEIQINQLVLELYHAYPKDQAEILERIEMLVPETDPHTDQRPVGFEEFARWVDRTRQRLR